MHTLWLTIGGTVNQFLKEYPPLRLISSSCVIDFSIKKVKHNLVME